SSMQVEVAEDLRHWTTLVGASRAYFLTAVKRSGSQLSPRSLTVSSQREDLRRELTLPRPKLRRTNRAIRRTPWPPAGTGIDDRPTRSARTRQGSSSWPLPKGQRRTAGESRQS